MRSRAFFLSPMLVWCLFASVVAGGLGGFSGRAEALTNVQYHGATGCYVPVGAPNSTTLTAVIAELTWDACVLLPRTMAGSASGNWAITGNLTIPDRITLVIPHGPKLVPAAGVTLTLAPPHAGDYAIFNADETTTGAIRFSAGVTREIPAAWFGVVCDNSVDVGLPLAAAAKSLPSVDGDFQGGKVILPAGICKTSLAWTPTKPFHLIGQGGGRPNSTLNNQTTLNYTGAGNFLTITGSGMSGTILEGFNIDHNPTGATADVGIEWESGAHNVILRDVTINIPATPFGVAGIRVGEAAIIHSGSLQNVFVRTSAPVGLQLLGVSSTLLIFDSTIQHHTTANVQVGHLTDSGVKEVRAYNSRFENTNGGDGLLIYRAQYLYLHGCHFELTDDDADGAASIRVPATATANNYIVVENTRFNVATDATARPVYIDNAAQLIEFHRCVFGGADSAGTGGYIFNVASKYIKVHHSFRDHAATTPIIAITNGSTLENTEERWTVSQGAPGLANGYVPERLCQSFEAVASVTTNNETLATCTIPASTIYSSVQGFTVHAFGTMADDTDSKTVSLTIDGTTVSTLTLASAAGGEDTWEIRCTGGKSAAAAGLNLRCHSLIDDDQSTTAVLYEASVSQGVTLSGTWLVTDVVISVVANGTDADDIVLRGFSVMLLR